MAIEFVIKRNDTFPFLELTLEDSKGPINLTEAEEVTFYMKGAELISGEMVVTDKAGGIVAYEWGTEDTKTAGVYKCECEIKWKSGRIQTIPNEGNFEIKVENDLGP